MSQGRVELLTSKGEGRMLNLSETLPIDLSLVASCYYCTNLLLPFSFSISLLGLPWSSSSFISMWCPLQHLFDNVTYSSQRVSVTVKL